MSTPRDKIKGLIGVTGFENKLDDPQKFGKYHPSKISNGSSSLINDDLKGLLSNGAFIDKYMTPEIETAIDAYLENKEVTIFGPNFDDEADYSAAASHWIVKSLEKDLSSPSNKGLFELILLSQYSDRKINYITYSDENEIILKKIDPVINSLAIEKISDAFGKATKDGSLEDLLSNTFLAILIEDGYGYEEFKLKVSENLSDKLINSNENDFQVQIDISPEFLGQDLNLTEFQTSVEALVVALTVIPSFGASVAMINNIKSGSGDGPLSIEYDGNNAYLSKEFKTIGVEHSTTIPANKIKKFKEVTKWNTRASIFGKTNPPEDEQAIYYTNEQIDTFAKAIRGKDLAANPFSFYTGEFYDSWGVLFDGDYWTSLAGELDKTRELATDAVISTIFENPDEIEGEFKVKITPLFKGHLLKDFEAETDAPVLPDINEEEIGQIATIGFIAWATAKGLSVASYMQMAYVLKSAGVLASVPTSQIPAVYATLVSEGAVLRGIPTLVRATRFLANVGSKVFSGAALKAAIVLGALAWWGYAIWNTKEESQTDRLNKEILKQYMNFMNDAVVAFAAGESVGSKFRKSANDTEFLKRVLRIFAIDKEVERRVRLWNRFSFELKQDENFLDNDAAIAAAIDDSISKGFKDIPLPDITTLTDEQIQDRQKFYKQCALMMNMSKLAIPYEQHIIDRQASENPDGPNPEKPFGGRFWRATSENKEQLINNIFSSEKSQYLFETSPHIMTQLVPKFRLYKVLNDPSGNLQRTEFVFPMHTDLSRGKNFTNPQASRPGVAVEGKVQSFLEAEFDKGDGVGLKSFTLEFNGTNPAEARNDVKGTMTLFFQSFADFIRERKSYNGDTFSFVDLIVQPSPDDDKHVQGLPVTSLRQYDPSFYRIMVETGYNVPDSLEGIGSDLPNIQSAIKNMNKSFYLCMIDHSFNIKNDGTVEVSLTYRAYVETALKSLRYDALATPEVIQQRLINETKLNELAISEKCTIDQLTDAKKSIAAIEEGLLRQSLSSIMKRLQKNNKIFNCVIDDNHRRQFLDNGYFRECDILGNVALDDNKANANSGDLGVVLNTRLPENSDGFDFNDADKNDTLVQYFFFGDLLYTVLDSLYLERDNGKARGLANTMIVLGSFEFQLFQETQTNSFNISHIPISVEFFSRWFVDNVLSQKSTRRTFPILNFIRSLSNALVSNAMLEACVNRDIEKRLIFQTGQFSSYSDTKEDKIGSLIGVSKANAILDTDDNRLPSNIEGTNTVQPAGLPLEGSPAGDSKIENFFHYIILNPNGSTRSHKGIGDYALDIGSGIFHIEIGSNRGLVKTVQFSKTDLQYVREARFMRNGVDGLLQLSSVYSVSIEMFGNTLFYPGMDLWLNPYGFGGTALGHPRTGGLETKRSLANVLGIGGYHTITGVSTTLTPSSFTTSVKAQHYYSGDKENNSVAPSNSVPKSSDELLIETFGIKGDENKTSADARFCEKAIVDLQEVMGGAPFVQVVPQEEIEAQTSEQEPSAGANTANLTTEQQANLQSSATSGDTRVVTNRSNTSVTIDGKNTPLEIVSYSNGEIEYVYKKADGSEVRATEYPTV